MRPNKACQCDKNIRAVLGHYGIGIVRMISVAPDRAFIEPDWQFPFVMERLVVHEEFAPWNHCIKDHGESALCGWRECRAKCSMQIILHYGYRIECDFDYWNPDYGALPAAMHFGEVLFNYIRKDKTNPFKIAKQLRKRGFDV